MPYGRMNSRIESDYRVWWDDKYLISGIVYIIRNCCKSRRVFVTEATVLFLYFKQKSRFLDVIRYIRRIKKLNSKVAQVAYIKKNTIVPMRVCAYIS